MSLCQVKIDQFKGNHEVGFIEVILDIPTNLTEFLSLLDGSVEEGQHIKHGLEFPLGTTVEDFLRKLRVCLLDILAETIWGFSYDLNRFLKDTKRETVIWRSSQPKSEGLIWLGQIL
jgi:hypothetical protein